MNCSGRNPLNVLSLCETWHENSEATCIKRLRDIGYSVIERARPLPEECQEMDFVNHGGVAMICDKSLQVSRLDNMPSFKTFECVGGKITSRRSTAAIVTVYRPGSKPVTNNFFQEFQVLLAYCNTFTMSVYIMGDMNIRLDRPQESTSTKFNTLLEDYNYTQCVTVPTHDGGGLLDVIISRTEDKQTAEVIDVGLSDHRLVRASINFNPPQPIYEEVTCRAWRKFNFNNFRNQLKETIICDDNFIHNSSLTDLVQKYDEVMLSLINQNAPFHSIRRRQRRSNAWYDDDCRLAKQLMRRFERHHKRFPSDESRGEWLRAQREYRATVETTRSTFWKEKLDEEKKNPKRLWQSLLSVCGKGAVESSADLSAEDFATFFTEKIQNLFPKNETSVLPVSNTCDSNLREFDCVTLEDIEKLIRSSPNKQCPLDPIPTWLVKKCCPEVAPYLLAIVQRSLTDAVVPNALKRSLITPILKKSSLSTDIANNYRPISGLSYLSKLLERVVVNQITKYLNNHKLLSKYQSAYRRFHSTETALLRILSDMINAVEDGKVALVAILDMSAAFDTVNHEILIHKLKNNFGIENSVLRWITSYLAERYQTVAFGDKRSLEFSLCCGVPQGSVLGPLLFILYTSDLEPFILSRGLICHSYADDYFLLKISDPCEMDDCRSSVVLCIDEVSKWMCKNRLKLNASKTEFMWIASPRRQHLIDSSPITVSGVDIVPLKSVRFLGIYFDQNIVSMSTQLGNTIKSSVFYLRQLKSIRRCLPTDSAKTLVNALVVSRLDYCNSLYAGLPNVHLNRLQGVFNTAARLVYSATKYCHITPLLRDCLHWLRVTERVEFKICLMVYKALNGLAPSYLTDLCVRDNLTQRQLTLRSAKSDASNRLIEPSRTNTSKFGDRAFNALGPHSWNNLPNCLRSESGFEVFKRKLKTYLFTRGYQL